MGLRDFAEDGPLRRFAANRRLSVCRWMLIAFSRSALQDGTLSVLDSALERYALVASAVAVAALLARAFGHTAIVFGAMDALHWSNIHLIAIESRWGHAWRLQLLGIAAVVVCAFSIRVSRRLGWPVYTIAAFTLCAVIPRLGHGATSSGHLVLHVLHLVGVAVWLGTLTVMVLLYFREFASQSPSQIRDTLVILLRRFSNVALPASGITVLSGVIAAVIYVGSFSNLWMTPYGRTLLLKITGFAGVVVCGWRNWRRLRTVKSPRPRTLITEIVFAAAVVAITGLLTETEHP